MKTTIYGTMGHARLVGLALVLALSSVGCGSKAGPAVRGTESYGTAIKSVVYEFCALARQRGVKAAKAEVSTSLERLEGYKEQHLGEHFETYKQIQEKLTTFQTLTKGKPSNADVKRVVDELALLADRLPGQADKNPVL